MRITIHAPNPALAEYALRCIAEADKHDARLCGFLNEEEGLACSARATKAGWSADVRPINPEPFKGLDNSCAADSPTPDKGVGS